MDMDSVQDVEVRDRDLLPVLTIPKDGLSTTLSSLGVQASKRLLFFFKLLSMLCSKANAFHKFYHPKYQLHDPMATLFLDPDLLPSEWSQLPLHPSQHCPLLPNISLLCTWFYPQSNWSKPILHYHPPAKTLQNVSHSPTKLRWIAANLSSIDQHSVRPVAHENFSLVKVVFLLHST